MMQSPVELGSLLAGKYRVERVIGHGGMGIVVAANHDELDHRVAIKFLSPEGAKGSEWVTRFAREARAAAKIRNEHAVKVYDVGRLDGGIPYMVMEYLEGSNLDDLLGSRTCLPLEEAADYLLQACEALAEAHLVGIVHRDLKPANLFLTHRSDGSTCVKILDFGISKVDDGVLGSGVITHTQSLVGSPLYMSPERLRGLKDVDRRADIWSLGVLLQEMLTGEPSFPADTIPDIHAKVLTGEPTPLRNKLPTATPELEAVVRRCLEREPEKRFQTVLEFARALGALAPASWSSVERIARITSGSGRKGRVSLNDASRGSFPPEPTTGQNAKLAETAAEESAPFAPIRFVPPSTESIPNVSATGTLGDRIKRSTGKLSAAAAIVVVAVVGTVLVMRTHHARAPTKTALVVAAQKDQATSPPPSTVTAVAPPTPRATETQGTETTEPSGAAVTATPQTTTQHHGSRFAHAARDAGVVAEQAPSASAPPHVEGAPGFVDYGGRN
jgi:serine/threonine-protein kinase